MLMIGRNVYTSSVASHVAWGLHSQTLIIMIHHGDQSVYKTMQLACTQSSTNCTQEKRSWRFFSLHSPFLRRINANFPKSYIQTRAIMVTMCGHSTLGIVPCTALVHASLFQQARRAVAVYKRGEQGSETKQFSNRKEYTCLQ